MPGVKTFQVSAVMPAEAPGLNGIGKFQYDSGIYCEEAGVKKALFLELRDFLVNMHVRGARKSPNILHLFAMEIVPEEMRRSLVTRAPAGQNFEPRRGRAGWVVHGDRPFHICPQGWVWQEAYNGPLTFYHVQEGQTFEFHQFNPDSDVRYWDYDQNEFVTASQANGAWQHNTYTTWINDFLRRYGQEDDDEEYQEASEAVDL